MANGGRSLLHIDTGGTIAQVREEGRLGYAGSERGEGESFLTTEQEEALRSLGVAKSIQLFSKDSTLMRPEDWTAIGRVIDGQKDSFDGFVVTHGTDTLAYTASVLSWMVGVLRKPVVLTGAQIPMRDPASLGCTDAWANLVNAVRVARDGVVNEVCVVFGSRVLRGNRCTKGDVFGLDAFHSPNCPELGRIGINIAYHPAYRPPELSLSEIRIPEEWATVVALKLFPGLDADMLLEVLKPDVDGLVVEGFPSGWLPPSLLDVLVSSGRVSVICLPGIVGLADAFYYEPTYWVESGPVVSGRDMTREAAITKLMWALAVADGIDDVISLVKTNLAGEMQADLRVHHAKT